MEDYNKSIMYTFSSSLKMSEISYLRSRLEAVDGITSFNIHTDSVQLEFDSLKLSQEYIKMIIMNLGYHVKSNEHTHKGIFRRFIQHLAKSNQEAFGDKKLDCCDLKHHSLKESS
jgi:copper chaperone CopZ